MPAITATPASLNQTENPITKNAQANLFFLIRKYPKISRKIKGNSVSISDAKLRRTGGKMRGKKLNFEFVIL